MTLRAASVLTLFAVVSLPGSVYARSHGERFAHLPQVTDPKNSQTMSLLEAPLNINPMGLGGFEIAIVDNTALVAEGDEGRAFVDAQKSGGQISVYTVRQGDTLSGIAEMFDVSTNTIMWANNLKGGKIGVGQELVILPISGVRHTVKSGDTLKGIATRYKAEVDDILLYNDLSVDAKIAVGDIIIVPNGMVTASSVSAPTTRSGVNSTTVSAGYYIRPINGGKKSQGIHGYNAVDLAAPVGTSIMASAAGKVMVARGSGYNGGYGLYVVIKHANGTQTLYAHMSRVNVSVGQSVERGQVIGAVGNTGRSTGPHVHFEIRGAKNPF